MATGLALSLGTATTAVATPTPTPQARARTTTTHAPRIDLRPLASCFDLAAQRYGMSSLLLLAVARQESGMNPQAMNRNSNGTVDVGLMQINSSWWPVLAKHGIRAADLWDPCTNIMVGAWILGDNLARMGPTIAALGAYNARNPVQRERYARQVLRHLEDLEHPRALTLVTAAR